MRESYSSAWLYGLVVVFISFFSAFMIMMLNVMEVQSAKTELMSIIEKYDGFTTTSRTIIDNYLKGIGYTTTGSCPSDYYAVTALDGTTALTLGGKGYYCVNSDPTSFESGKNVKYNIILFYRFNLPMVGEIYSFQINGQTDIIRVGSTGYLFGSTDT